MKAGARGSNPLLSSKIMKVTSFLFEQYDDVAVQFQCNIDDVPVTGLAINKCIKQKSTQEWKTSVRLYLFVDRVRDHPQYPEIRRAIVSAVKDFWIKEGSRNWKFL